MFQIFLFQNLAIFARLLVQKLDLIFSTKGEKEKEEGGKGEEEEGKEEEEEVRCAWVCILFKF